MSALDLACGEGFYTRVIRHCGAARVRGLDLPEAIIALAEAQEARQPLGVTYAVADARELSDEVDLTVAAYLLNYARTREELQAMCDGIARSLKPGGRFVTVNTNPAVDLTAATSYRPYGFETTAVGQWQEGTPIRWTFHLEDGPLTIENYHLSVAAHEEAFERAGFSEVRWHPPALSPEALSPGGAGGLRQAVLVDLHGFSTGDVHRVRPVDALRPVDAELPVPTHHHFRTWLPGRFITRPGECGGYLS